MSRFAVGDLGFDLAVEADGAADPGDFAFAHTLAPGPEGDDAATLRIAVEYRGAAPREARVRIVATLADAPDPWWLIPGLFYGENRPAGNDRLFPRFERDADEREAARTMVSSSWDFRADRAATPAVFVWAGPGRGGLALGAPDTTPLGLTGIGFGQDGQTGQAQLRLTFPFREFPITYFGSDVPRPAEEETHTWAPGERIEIPVTVFRLGTDRHGYAPVLRRLHAAAAEHAPLTPWVDVGTAAALAAEGLYRWHYDPDPGVLLETVGFDREVTGRDGLSVDRQAMHVGWVSGVPWAFALLRHARRVADPAMADGARRVIDFVCSALAPSGTFWGVWYRDRGWDQSWTRHRRGLHSRTLAEACLFLHRADIEEPGHHLWRDALRSNLDTIVARQREDGNLGSLHHAETGEVLSWAGSAGLTWVAVLAEAADLDPAYLPAAERAGEYYASFVEGEFLHGAPEDVDLAPTSEDGYLAVMSYAALYRRTSDRRWLALAQRAADWTLTFRYSYNVVFEPETLLGRYGFATRGADQASPSNQHLHAYGLICTGDLLDLSDWTGDPSYAARAEESLACFRQFIARRDGDFNAYRGMASERFYQTSCFQAKGMVLTLSHAWSVGVLLLGCEEKLARARASAEPQP